MDFNDTRSTVAVTDSYTQFIDPLLTQGGISVAVILSLAVLIKASAELIKAFAELVRVSQQ